jgi:hypothetical protein
MGMEKSHRPLRSIRTAAGFRASWTLQNSSALLPLWPSPWVWSALARSSPANTAPKPARKDRRLKLLEVLMLDPQRRIVLFSLDGEERLILLGEGRSLDTLPKEVKLP